MILPVKADTTFVITYYDFSHATTAFIIGDVHPSASIYNSAFAMSFNASENSGAILNVTITARKLASATGNITCKIQGWYENLTYAAPTSTVLEVANNVISCSDLTTSWTNITYTFDGTTPINDTRVCFVLYADTEVIDSTNQFNIKYGGSGNDYPYGRMANFNQEAWQTSTNDCPFIIYGTTYTAPTPTPEEPELWDWFADLFQNNFAFVLCLMGIVMVFFGGYWLIDQGRHREVKQMTNGLIILIVGLALSVGWLLGG